MKVLGIDTATWAGSIAVADDILLLGEIGIQATVTHADRLMSCIDFLLKNLRIAPEELDGIAVSAGPGSFTGLRIGMGTAKGLSLATKKPVVGVSTLHAMARSIHCNGFLSPLLDAGRGEIYGCCYRREGNRLVEVCPEMVDDPVRFLKKISVPELFLFGTGADKFRKEIEEIGLSRFRFLPFHHFIASSVAIMGLEILKEGRTVKLTPNYIRRSNAELQRENRIKDR
ncbi:MAG: tRNA (adenosine(37)-N6)-threonylcarbamoyltransferase complex dimerization subunit type 1 TsaB [Acidobacteriota bacterium]